MARRIWSAGMSRVARYAKMVAHPGKGADAAERLLDAAAELEADPGCELYLINRQAGEPDVVWVTEVWRSQADSTPPSRRSAAAGRSPR
jgi:quinol monooxygenase YgiN